jgi:hypothetical protein
MESRRSCVVNPRRKQGRYDVNEPDRMAQVVAGNGNGKPSAESHAKAARLARVEEADVCFYTYMTASELETHLVRAITARTSGRVQGLRVQIQGGRTVLSGFSESYYAIQLALAGLMETLNALGLDHPERVDLNIDVLPYRPAQPQAASVLPGPPGL